MHCVYTYFFAEFYQPHFRVPVVRHKSRDVLCVGEKGPEPILACEDLAQSLLGFGSHSLDQDSAGLFPVLLEPKGFLPEHRDACRLETGAGKLSTVLIS